MSIESFFQRHRGSLQQFCQFGLIGGLGVFVNAAAFAVISIIFREGIGVTWRDAAFGIPGTPYSIRYYHLFMVFSFLVANLFNFVLNRHWTFKSTGRAPFFREYLPFLAVGSLAQGFGLVIMTLLLHPNSPLVLPDAIFDDSTGFRTKSHWANLIQIILVMPINFVVNKLWTFRFIRNRYSSGS